MSERTTDYTNDAQQRIIKVILVLFSDPMNGLSPSQLAREMACSASVMTRDISNLVTAGVAEKVEKTDLVRLTSRLPQQAIKVLLAIDAEERRVQEARQRFTRLPAGQSLSDMAHRFDKNQD